MAIPTGFVTTAKGKLLNFTDLIAKSKQPMTPKGDLRNEVKPAKPAPRQLNIRGFSPITSTTVPPVVEDEPDDTGEGTSLADLTAITIDKPKHLKQRPDDAMDAANEALQEITSDLAAMSKKPNSKR